MLASPVSHPTLTLPTHLQTVEEFEAWQRLPGHDGSFEFVRGQLIPKSMKQDEVEIAAFLQSQFATTAAARAKHLLMLEADSYVDATRKRIPDLTYFTAEQRQAIRRGEWVNTLFAIEILSDSETHQDVIDKIQDYFERGRAIGVVHRAHSGYCQAPENLRLHVTRRIDRFQRRSDHHRRAGAARVWLSRCQAIRLFLLRPVFP